MIADEQLSGATQPEVRVVALGPLAVKFAQARALLGGISVGSFWKRRNLPASDPRRINVNSDNTVAVAELARHVQADREWHIKKQKI
jgi:hypothetical protein